MYLHALLNVCYIFIIVCYIALSMCCLSIKQVKHVMCLWNINVILKKLYIIDMNQLPNKMPFS